jgi:hypothetical protein
MTWSRRLLVMTLVLATGLCVGLVLGKNQPKDDPKPATPPIVKAAISPLSNPQFEELKKVIQPQPGEDLFDTIPWQVSLWQARTLAAKEGKPILLWEMDGHPLGCG